MSIIILGQRVTLAAQMQTMLDTRKDQGQSSKSSQCETRSSRVQIVLDRVEDVNERRGHTNVLSDRPRRQL